MVERFIKLPTGCTKSPEIGIISNKIGATKSQILGTLACASELFFEEKTERTDTIELISYMLSEPEELIQKIISALQLRGFLDEKMRVIGMSTISESAERKRRWREKNKARNGQSQDSHRTGTDSPDKEIEQTKETKLKKETEQTKQAAPINAQGSGSFSGLGEVVGRLLSGQGKPFDIRNFLKDEDFTEIYQYTRGYDPKFLFEKYNSYYANNPPNEPGKNAYIGWLKKFTQGKGARP